MASVASQLLEDVTAHAQSDSLEDARASCADGTYFPINLRNSLRINSTQVQHSNPGMDWSVLLVFLCFNRVPEDGAPEPKYAGVNVHYELYFMNCILLYFI